MAVNGYKIFDSDTHVGPSADILERYMSAADRDKLGEFAEFQRVNRKTGHKTYNFNTRQYNAAFGRLRSQASQSRRVPDGVYRPAPPTAQRTGGRRPRRAHQGPGHRGRGT